MATLDDLLSIFSSGNPATQQSSSGVITPAPQDSTVPNSDAGLLQLLAAAGLVPNPMQLPADTMGDGIPATTTTPQEAPNPMLEALQTAATATTVAAVPVALQKAAGAQPMGADVNGGAARVNARTDQTGIRAVTDAQGNVTLTNMVGDNPMALGPTSPKIQKGGVSYSPTGVALDANQNPIQATQEQKGIANSVQALVSTLRETKDADTARGIMSQANEALAREQAKFFTQAQQFASNKLQIPLLESQLAQAQSLDSQRIGWQPGMAESANTTKLRQSLDNARKDADTEAKRYLQGNISYNSLIATSKNLEAEGQRIVRMSDKIDTMEANRQFRSEDKKLAMEEAAQQAAAGLTLEQKNRLRVLHPELKEATDVDLVNTIKKHATKTDGYTLALDTPDEKLPELALQNNSYASAILAAKEEAAGVPSDVTRERLKALRQYSTDKAAIAQGIQIMSGTRDRKAVDAQVASLNALTAPGATKESKQQAVTLRAEYAKAVLGERVKQQFIGDVTQWAIADPVIQQAIISAQNTVGKKDMQSVLTQYVGAATGAERRKLIDTFVSAATTAAKRTSGSTLGAVDPNAIKLLVETTETRSLIDRVLKSSMWDSRQAGGAFNPELPPTFSNTKF